jgi:hypothetical protein
MSLKAFIIGLTSTCVLGLGVWIWTLLTVDPTRATLFEFILFFAALFIWLVALFALVLFVVRLFRTNNEFFYGNVVTSLRQGGFVASYIVILSVLQAMRLLMWGEVVLILMAFALFEMYFWAKRK